ncbi:MAG: hypothetical protein AB1540_13735 [Bdellovibrionota bacterium]
MGDPIYRAASGDGSRWVYPVWDRNGVVGDNDWHLRGVGHGNNTFVVAGGSALGRIFSTTNGRDWVEYSDNRGWFGDAEYGQGYYFAVGGNGRWVYSTDAERWTIPGLPTFPAHETGTSGNFRAVAYGNNRFVAVGNTYGNNGLIRSFVVDPLQPSRPIQAQIALTDSRTRLDAVVFAENRFVAVGEGGRIALSTDSGTTWANQNLPEGGYLGSIAHGNSTFVVISNGRGYVHISRNGGQSWSTHEVNRSLALAGSGITFGDGVFIATFYHYGTSTMRVYRSSDGMTWQEISANAGAPINLLSFGSVVSDLQY